MAETLFLHLPAADQAVGWLPVDTLGNRIGRVQQGGLTDAAAAARGRRLRVLVPGVHISLLRTSVPTRNPQKLLQAVPFALEDLLAEDIESLHFAIGPRDADGCSVAVLQRARLEQWLQQLADAGLKADELIPDMLALPAHP
ncbi:MAG TPA: type II secretion system protein GspL, partial [Gammaproteobacteria bacterium]|nr:type II secretion system protein GspL [Gammaproteobacteria bacterium]